jgi:hypothetical protein
MVMLTFPAKNALKSGKSEEPGRSRGFVAECEWVAMSMEEWKERRCGGWLSNRK